MRRQVMKGYIALAALAVVAGTLPRPAFGGVKFVGEWMVSVDQDRFGGGDKTVIARPQRSGAAVGVRCFNRRMTLYVVEPTASFEGITDIFRVMFRVDQQPVMTTIGEAVETNAAEIIGLRGMIEQLRRGGELALRFSTKRAQWDRIYDLSGIAAALPAIERECPADKVMDLGK